MAGSDISPELVERCVALVRKIADAPPGSPLEESYYGMEARMIDAELPKPVDPDLLEARAFVCELYRDNAMWVADMTLRGDDDDRHVTQLFQRAIKRGRELATTQRESK